MQLPEPFVCENYTPTDEEHRFVNLLALLKKHMACLLLDGYDVEVDELNKNENVHDKAGLFFKNGMYYGAMTVEMVEECFNAIKRPQNKSTIEQFASAFNRFTDIEQLEINGNFIAMLLAFMYHEAGGLESKREVYGAANASQPYWKPAGAYSQIYCGRGQIQITWEYTYRALDAYFQSKPEYS